MKTIIVLAVVLMLFAVSVFGTVSQMAKTAVLPYAR